MKDQVFALIKKEEKRQGETLMLIPSENYSSKEVREAVGSVLAHKYSEGYPGKRYYQGNAIIDEIENLAISRAKKLFGVEHVNVQPYSGSPANSAVYYGLLNYGDKIMGMGLSSGGHLTHGHPKITFSGKYFKSVQYDVNEYGDIDYKALAKLVKKEKPKLIMAGYTAYSKLLDWKRFSEIADSVNAYLVADISHIAGLVAAKAIESPVDFVDVITTTTHKTLRGPRGAMIMITKKGLQKNPDLGKIIDRAVFPGLQGGPHENTIAGIAVALEEAGTKEFRNYAKNIIKNAKALSKELTKLGFEIVSSGTENHMFLIDLRSKGILGKEYAVALEKAGIIVNANAIPHDPNPPMNPSGIRVGTPAVTSRGMGIREMKMIAHWMDEVAKNLDKTNTLNKIKKEVKTLTSKWKL